MPASGSATRKVYVRPAAADVSETPLIINGRRPKSGHLEIGDDATGAAVGENPPPRGADSAPARTAAAAKSASHSAEPGRRFPARAPALRNDDLRGTTGHSRPWPRERIPVAR